MTTTTRTQYEGGDDDETTTTLLSRKQRRYIDTVQYKGHGRENTSIHIHAITSRKLMGSTNDFFIRARGGALGFRALLFFAFFAFCVSVEAEIG